MFFWKINFIFHINLSHTYLILLHQWCIKKIFIITLSIVVSEETLGMLIVCAGTVIHCSVISIINFRSFRRGTGKFLCSQSTIIRCYSVGVQRANQQAFQKVLSQLTQVLIWNHLSYYHYIQTSTHYISCTLSITSIAKRLLLLSILVPLKEAQICYTPTIIILSTFPGALSWSSRGQDW